MRAYDNNWQDAIMGEIELGSSGAYIAMAWDSRNSNEFNRTYDHGIAGMEIWHIFEVDYLVDERGHTVEEAYEKDQNTPWGPYDWTDEMLAEDETQVQYNAEFVADQVLEHELRKRP